MAVVSFMTTKGGAGKTTGTLFLGTVLAEQSASLCLVDADPNQPLIKWSKDANIARSMTIVGVVNEENSIETIEEQSGKNSFVIDLEGSANLSTGYAMTSSDLILIPLQPSKLDADEAAKALKFIARQGRSRERKCRRASSGRVPAAYVTRSARDIGTQFEVQAFSSCKLASWNAKRSRGRMIKCQASKMRARTLRCAEQKECP